MTSLAPAKFRGAVGPRFVLLGGAQIFGSALSFATTVIISRIGGAEVLGQISVGISVLAYCLILTNFGTDVSGVKAAAAQPATVGSLLPAIFLMRLICALLSFAAVLVLSPVLAPEPHARLVLIIIVSGVFAAVSLPAWLPQSQENIGVTTFATFAPFAITFIFTALAAWVQPGSVTFALGRLGGDLFTAAFLSAWAWQYRSAFDWLQIKAQIRGLIVQSGTILGSQLVRGLAFLTDVLIVSFFYHDATVGHFSAAYRIYLLLLSVSAMFFIVYFPRVVRAAGNGSASLRQELSQSFRWSVPGACVAATFVVLIAPWFLPFAFGSEFTESVPVLQILAVGAVLNFVHRNYSRALIALGHPERELLATAIATFVGIGLKVVATSQWGIAGTALAIVSGEIVLLLMLRTYMGAKLRDREVA